MRARVHMASIAEDSFQGLIEGYNEPSCVRYLDLMMPSRIRNFDDFMVCLF